MEAAFKKVRAIVAIVATVVVGAAMFQTIGPASAAPVQSHHLCPPMC
jgi:hypothetical protein